MRPNGYCSRHRHHCGGRVDRGHHCPTIAPALDPGLHSGWGDRRPLHRRHHHRGDPRHRIAGRDRRGPFALCLGHRVFPQRATARPPHRPHRHPHPDPAQHGPGLWHRPAFGLGLGGLHLVWRHDRPLQHHGPAQDLDEPGAHGHPLQPGDGRHVDRAGPGRGAPDDHSAPTESTRGGSVGPGLGRGQGDHLLGHDVRGRHTDHSVADGPHRRLEFSGTFPAGHHRHRPGDWLCHLSLRPLLCLWRLHRRHGAQRVRLQPPGPQRHHPPARSLWTALLCLRGHVAGPDVSCRQFWHDPLGCVGHCFGKRTTFRRVEPSLRLWECRALGRGAWALPSR